MLTTHGLFRPHNGKNCTDQLIRSCLMKWRKKIIFYPQFFFFFFFAWLRLPTLIAKTGTFNTCQRRMLSTCGLFRPRNVCDLPTPMTVTTFLTSWQSCVLCARQSVSCLWNVSGPMVRHNCHGMTISTHPLFYRSFKCFKIRNKQTSLFLLFLS